MSRLNALHTLPAPLAPATRLWARGKALVSFYKTGISNVWNNRRLARSIRLKYDVGSGSELARSIVENIHLAEIEHKVLAKPSAPTLGVGRDELLTVLRTERDFPKLPLFVVVFAVCFEMTPLVLWAFPRLAPSTCWSQGFNGKLQAAYETRRASLLRASPGLSGSESVFQLPPAVLRSLAQTLDFGRRYAVAPLGVVRHRVARHLLTVRADDALLRQHADHLADLAPEELRRALMARGLPPDGGVAALAQWIAEFREPMDAGFLCIEHRRDGLAS